MVLLQPIHTMISVSVDPAYHNIMTDTLPTHSNDMMKSLLAGLYSDFAVVVDDKVYRLHKFILGDYSGFFNGLFRTQPNQTSVVFDTDHLLAHDITIWEHLLAVWYKNNDHKSRQHDAFDYQQVIATYTAVCEYLSCQIPKIRFRERKFLPTRVKVDYNGEKNEVTFTFDQVTKKLSNAKSFRTKEEKRNGDKPPMTSAMAEVVGLVNLAIKTNTRGRHVDLLSYLAVVEVTNPEWYGDCWPVILVNNNSVSSDRFDNDSQGPLTFDIETGIRKSLPHAVWW